MPQIQIQNLKINYTESGKGQPLLFIHGLLSDSRRYKRFIDALSKTNRVYAIDLPMHGKSSSSKEYLSVEDLSEILKKFIGKLRIENPVVCSHSGGCIMAIDFASKNKINELILIEPTGIPYYNSLIGLNLKLICKTFVHLVKHPMRTVIDSRIGIQNLLRNLFNRNYWRLVNENLKKDYSGKMRKISCTTKIFWARDDEICPFIYAEEFTKKIKNAELIAVEGGHDWIVYGEKGIKQFRKVI